MKFEVGTAVIRRFVVQKKILFFSIWKKWTFFSILLTLKRVVQMLELLVSGELRC